MVLEIARSSNGREYGLLVKRLAVISTMALMSIGLFTATPSSAITDGPCTGSVTITKVNTPADVKAKAQMDCVAPAHSIIITFDDIWNLNTGTQKAHTSKSCAVGSLSCQVSVTFDCNHNGQTYYATAGMKAFDSSGVTVSDITDRDPNSGGIVC